MVFKNIAPCTLEESSLSIRRVKYYLDPDLCANGLMLEQRAEEYSPVAKPNILGEPRNFL